MMKKIILLCVLVVVILTGCSNNSIKNNTENDGIQYQKISAKEANSMIEKKEYDIILDVRTLE